jgi:hypothetical protein
LKKTSADAILRPEPAPRAGKTDTQGGRAVTTAARKIRKNNMFARVLSIFLALLIVAGSLAAIVELL